MAQHKVECHKADDGSYIFNFYYGDVIVSHKTFPMMPANLIVMIMMWLDKEMLPVDLGRTKP